MRVRAFAASVLPALGKKNNSSVSTKRVCRLLSWCIMVVYGHFLFSGG